MSTREEPERNSRMITSRVFCTGGRGGGGLVRAQQQGGRGRGEPAAHPSAGLCNVPCLQARKPAPGVPSPAQCPCPVPLPRAPAPCPCPVPLPKPPPWCTWSMSPWVADTVWSRSRILSVSQSTCGVGWGVGGIQGGRGGVLGQPTHGQPAARGRPGSGSGARADCGAAAAGAAGPGPAPMPGTSSHLPAGVGEDDRLGDGQGLVQVAQGVQLPVLALLEGVGWVG